MSATLPPPGTVILRGVGLTRVLPGPVPFALVSDIDVSFRAGSFSVVTGPSGSGKSSLLYLLGLLDLPTKGEVVVDDSPTAALDADEHHIGARDVPFGDLVSDAGERAAERRCVEEDGAQKGRTRAGTRARAGCLSKVVSGRFIAPSPALGPKSKEPSCDGAQVRAAGCCRARRHPAR